MTNPQNPDPTKFFQPRESKPCNLTEFDKLEADHETLLIMLGRSVLLHDQTLHQQIKDGLLAMVRSIEAKMDR